MTVQAVSPILQPAFFRLLKVPPFDNALTSVDLHLLDC